MSVLKPVQQSQKLGCGCIWVFAIFWNSFIGFAVLGDLFRSGFNAVNMFFGLFLIPFVLVGIGLLGLAVYVTYGYIGKRLTLATPEATISQNPLRVGESFRFTYCQPFKRAAQISAIDVRLVLRETAIYRRGTNTTTVTHEHVRDQVAHAAQRYERGQAFYEDRTFQIPADGMHTFVAERNKLQWFVKVQIKLAGWPDVTEAYEVAVVPHKELYGSAF